MAEDGLEIRTAEEKNRKIIFAFMRSERLVPIPEEKYR